MEKSNKIFYGWWIVIGSILVTATIVPSVMAMANKFLIPVTTDMGIKKPFFIILVLGMIFNGLINTGA